MPNDGVYLKCDPAGGWFVVLVASGGERTLAGSFFTMEEAIRAATTTTYQPIYIPFLQAAN